MSLSPVVDDLVEREAVRNAKANIPRPGWCSVGNNTSRLNVDGPGAGTPKWEKKQDFCTLWTNEKSLMPNIRAKRTGTIPLA